MFGEGGSAPSFAPHADAEHCESLFYFHYSLLTELFYFCNIKALFFTSKITFFMGRRKKNRTADSIARKAQKIIRDKKKLKRLKKLGAVKAA